jgi:hypothetical protein
MHISYRKCPRNCDLSNIEIIDCDISGMKDGKKVGAQFKNMHVALYAYSL